MISKCLFYENVETRKEVIKERNYFVCNSQINFIEIKINEITN